MSGGTGEALIPIDIHYNKLLDWQISRRHCDINWQKDVLIIREKINEAIQDMPPVEEISQLLQGTYINYFHCLRIVELLKDTESSTKNIFGRYSSQRMKDWQEIVSLYEKNGVYMAEAAQLLTRNVNFEIPTIKKQIAKCQQIQTDCIKKESEYLSSAAEHREKYATQCKHMGIEGIKVRSELLELVRDIPSVYKRVGESACDLKPTIQYYSEFIKFTLSNDELAAGCLPLVRYLSEHGDTTTYEWRTGSVPVDIIEPLKGFMDKSEEEQENGVSDEIDWGATEDAENGDIDWGEDNVEGDGIDWGDSGDKIEIEVVDESGVQTESDTDKNVARGTDALTLLDNTETRDQIINELLEVEAFLRSRLTEAEGEGDVVSSYIFQSAPESINQDAENIQMLIADVTSILSKLTSPKMTELILIRSSPRYVDRTTANLKKTQELANKMTSLSKLMVTKHKDACEEQRTYEPKLDLIRVRTKELKKQNESEISKKYHNRPVNIMGEINTI